MLAVEVCPLVTCPASHALGLLPNTGLTSYFLQAHEQLADMEHLKKVCGRHEPTVLALVNPRPHSWPAPSFTKLKHHLSWHAHLLQLYREPSL